MRHDNLQEFISFLDKKDEVQRISAVVDCHLEISEITDRCVKSGGPALIFENVRGFDTRVVTNIFGTHQRTAWALGVEDSSELPEQVQTILNMLKDPPTNMLGKLNALKDVAGIVKSRPKLVKTAPCQDIILTDSANLEELPHLKCWPLDGGRYITLPLVISQDPVTKRRNVGTYRMQIYDSKKAGMHWQTHKVGASHFRHGKDLNLDKMEVAVVMGADPTTMWTGALPLPPELDELAISGLLRGRSVETVKCKTIDLEVPAQAEFVLEGFVIPNEVGIEGPFGDHTGYYSLEDEYPIFHLTAITHRKNPIYPATVVGRPPSEDYFMGKAIERFMLPALQIVLPEIQDINMPAEGVFHNLVIVSVKKEYPGHTRKIMNAMWGLGLLMLAKTIIVVDDFVNVHNLSEVAWRVTSNIDPVHDVIFSDGPVDDLDHASRTPKIGSKMGIDATIKGKEDGRLREWPPDVLMDTTIKKMVDDRWHEYGFPSI